MASDQDVETAPHGGEPFWVVVAEMDEEEYASTAVDAPDEETATAQGERVIVQNEGQTPERMARTTGPFPATVPTEDREIRPKVCAGCGLQRFCGNHAPTPHQTWWTLVEEQSDGGHRAWECVSCGTLTRMPKEEATNAI